MNDQLISLQEAAKLLNVSYSYLWKKCRAGEVPTVKLSRRCVRIRMSDVSAWLNAHVIAGDIAMKIKASHAAKAAAAETQQVVAQP